ncbi:hypothetical protein NEOC84_000849|nr:hypothetical protein [Neochlamydia sp. AcF84]
MCAQRTAETLDKNSSVETKQDKIRFFIKARIVVNKLLSQAIFMFFHYLCFSKVLLFKGSYKRGVKYRHDSLKLAVRADRSANAGRKLLGGRASLSPWMARNLRKNEILSITYLLKILNKKASIACSRLKAKRAVI